MVLVRLVDVGGSSGDRATGHAASRKSALVIVTAIWWVLIVAGLALEIVARIRPQVIAPLSRVGARLAGTVPLRMALWAGWIFIGLHLFTRDTLPHH
jgi:hypothetical protein